MAVTTINTTKTYGVGKDASYGNLGAFTPALYALETLEKFYKTTVFGEIANTKYEGQITKQGDKVVIRTRPTVTIRDYVKGASLTYETPAPSEVELVIDKAKYYAVNIDDIDKIQNDINAMDEWSADAGQQLAITIDSSILNSIYADVSTDNKGATAGAVSHSFNLGATGAPVQLTSANILDYIVDCETVLNEQNIPLTDRWIVLPAYFVGLIEKSDLRSALFLGEANGTNDVIRNGKIGKISNFTVYSTNNMTGVVDGANTCWNILFGHKSALTFASQLVKNEVLPNPNSFGTIMRGLQVYGYEVIQPTAMGVLYARK